MWPADNDKLDLLKADAAQINMDGLYAYGEAKPSASFTGSVKNTLDGLFNTFTNAITGARLRVLSISQSQAQHDVCAASATGFLSKQVEGRDYAVFQ